MRAPYPSDEARVADIMTFLLAGHDTTGYTVAWTLVELARNKDAMTCLQAELDGANPAHGDWDADSVRVCEILHEACILVLMSECTCSQDTVCNRDLQHLYHISMC